MNPSTPEPCITSDWELEAYSPASVGQSPEVTSPIRHREDVVDGARVKRFKFTPSDLARYFDSHDPYTKPPPPPCPNNGDTAPPAHSDSTTDGNVLDVLRHNSEIAVEIGKHLSPADIVALYSVSRAFHDAVDNYMLASVRAWVA